MKILNKIVVLTSALCVIGAPISVFGDCAGDENNCTTIAGNNFHQCITDAENLFTYSIIGCAATGPGYFICVAAFLATENVAIRHCNSQYDTDICNCQVVYEECVKGPAPDCVGN